MKSIDEIRVENLLILIKRFGSIQKLADALDRSHGQVSQWKNRAKSSKTGKPRGMESETARWIEKTLKLPENWLDTDHSEQEDDPDWSLVPVMDTKLSAGAGHIVFSIDEDKRIAFRTDYLRKRGIKPENAFGFPVDGHSMSDCGIRDGCLVMVNRGVITPVRKKFYAIWIEGKYLVKEIVKRGDMYFAVSHNEAEKDKYPDIPINSEDSGIIGQVFYCGFEL